MFSPEDIRYEKERKKSKQNIKHLFSYEFSPMIVIPIAVGFPRSVQ